MGRKERLKKIAAVMQDAVTLMDSRIPDTEKNAPGSWEVWAPKDAVFHTFEWLSRDFKKIDSPATIARTTGSDALDSVNREIYEKYRGKKWKDAVAFARSVGRELDARLNAMTDDGVETEITYDTGTKSAVWKLIGSHCGSHAAMHYSLVLRRAGDVEAATKVEEDLAAAMLALDSGAEWRGTVSYNLACHYCLSGNTKKAFTLLKEGLSLRPDLVEWSKKDPDFDGVRGDPEFKKIVENA